MSGLGYQNVSMSADAKKAHAEIVLLFEEGLASGADPDLAALMECVDDRLLVDSKGILLIPSKEFNFQSATSSMVATYTPVIHGMDVETAPFAGLFIIGEQELRLDRYAAKAASAKEAGIRAANRAGDVVRQGIPKLLTAKTFGGTNFFSQTQFIDPSKGAAGGTYANLYNLACTADNYVTVRAAMSARVDEGGVPRRTKPTHLIAASDVAHIAKNIVAAPNLFGGGTNTNYDPSIKVVEVEDLPSGAWILASIKGTVKPFGYHQTLKPHVTYVGPERDGVNINHVWRAMVEDTVVGIAPWKCSYSKPGQF